MNSETTNYPTPFDDINLFLQTLLDSERTVLGDYFIGMYLYGSLTTGDFDPHKSDIDFLIVTSKYLSNSLISDLKGMHTRICKSSLEWSTRLEGAYIPLDVIRVYSPTDPPYPLVNINRLFNRNVFLVASPEINWVINRHVLYTRGIVITGPPLQSIIDPVQSEQLQEAARTSLHEFYEHWTHNPDLLSAEGVQPFVVLSVCRDLYTLKCSDVASKRRSAEWVIANLDRKWAQLINQAMTWNHGDPSGDIDQTLEFMGYVLKEVGL